MKPILLLFFVAFTAGVCKANSYYFSSVAGDDNRTAVQAQNPATPWQTLAKFNSIYPLLQPGDSVLFKRGETFFGTADIRSSGVPGNVIYFGTYGAGANPLLSGFTTLSNWNLQGGGIYYASLDMPNLSIVTINGTAKGMGRYPNTGYLTYENNNANLSIIDNELPASPNWTGAEIVMRKFRFILDRHVVTSHAGTVLNYSTSTINGNNAEFLPVKGNGYFIQNHLSTLDQFGEWYYDATAKRLYVFFGANAPTDYVVKASAKTYNASVEGVDYVTLEGLGFEGGNQKGLNIAYATHVLVQNCTFFNQGGSSLYGDHISNVTIKGGSVNLSLSNGINLEHNADFCTVDGVSVFNSNMIPGSGRSGSGVSIGISVTGDNTTIINNKVINSGYSGIQFLGNNVLVEHNYVSNFCTLKDDGGGVYTFEGAANETNSNRKVKNNVILNAIGSFAGAGAYNYEPFGKASGVYLDEHVNNVEISGNTIANGDWAGIFMHNVHDNVFTNNLIFNHRYQVHVSQYDASGRNNTMTGNQYIARLASQATFYYRTFFEDNPASLGVLNNNYYARPIADNTSIQVDNLWAGGNGSSTISLAQWKAAYGQDAASQTSPITYASNIDDNLRFEYNETGVAKIVHLDASYVDVKGAQYAGDISLPPYSGVVLFKSAVAFKLNQVISFADIDSKSFGDAPFALTATSTSGLPVSFRVISGPANVAGNMLTLTGVGPVIIEASQAGNAIYKAADVVLQTLNVLPPNNQTITFPAIANKSFGVAPFALNATSSSGLPVSYEVISGLATLNNNILTITGAGISTIIVEARQVGNTNYKAAVPVRRSFTVSKGSQTINFGALPGKVYGDEPFNLTATASSSLPVSYKILSGPATVAGSTLTITGVGEVLVEASQLGNDNYNAASFVTQNFQVAKGSQTITFPAIANKIYGVAPFNLTATSSSGLPVIYQVLSGPATVQGSTVTITGVGEVLIEASQPGNQNYNPAVAKTRNFLVTTTKQNQTITFSSLPNRVFGAAPFDLTATSSSSLPVSYKVLSGPATVAGSKLTITGAGLVSIEASQGGNDFYNAASSITQVFTVDKASQTLNFGALAARAYGDAPFILKGKASSGLPVVYKILSGPATVLDSTLTLTGVGTVTVEASQPGDVNYNPAPAVSQVFAVVKGSQTINFPALAARTVSDSPFALPATASSGLTIIYHVTSGPATVSGNMLTLTGVGEVSIEATQPGDANYDPAPSATQSFYVTKGSQTITFTPLADRYYGDAPFMLRATSSSGLPVAYKVISGPATVSGNVLTLTGVGSVFIEASQPGNAAYNPAPALTQVFWAGLTDGDPGFVYEWSCPAGTKTFYAGTSNGALLYQWQVNKNDGAGYVDLTNANGYSGTTTPTLQLGNAPTANYGFTYRCRLTGNQGATYSPVVELRFYAIWTGASNNNWEAVGNWGCGAVPDGNTDVVIGGGLVAYPMVGSAAACHRVKLDAGATLTIKPGFKLTVTGKLP